MSWIYGIQSGRFIKVGTTVDIKARMDTFRLHNPNRLRLILKRRVREAPYWIEARMHRILDDYAVGREWFSCKGIEVKEAFAIASQDWIVHRDKEAMRRILLEDMAVEKACGTGTGRGIGASA